MIDRIQPPIHTARLRADHAGLTDEIIPLKAALRRRWPGPMADTQRRVHALAREITERSVLLAISRGRRHLRSAPRWMRDAGLAGDLEAWQLRVAQRLALEYSCEQVASDPAPHELHAR